MSDESNLIKELVGKIQQFFSHQVESNTELSEAAKESLTVATECIEQAYNVQKKPASRELVDIYKSHKTAPAAGGTTQANQATDPAQLIQNLASTFLTQVVGGGAASASATPSSNQSHPQQQTPTPGATTTGATTTQATASPGETLSSAPPRERKRVSEAERLAAESFKNQGNDMMKQDKYKEAYDYYTQAIDIDNNNAIYYSNRAAASSKLGDHQAALRDCKEAIEIDPGYSKAYGRMGLAYASMENHQKAKEAYATAVSLDPTNESYINNLAIAEEKLAEGSTGLGAGGGLGGPAAAAAAAAAGGFGGNQMAGMLRTMMSNPEVMNMAMRSLQDPRVQNLFGGILGGVVGGATGAGGGQTTPTTSDNPPPGQNQPGQNH